MTPRLADDALAGSTARAQHVGAIRHFLAFFLLFAATALAHGWALRDGLALDDHWHFKTVRASTWKPQELLDATTIDVEKLADVWWQKEPVRFVYARPVAVALLKLTYAASGDSPVAAHAVSLALHLCCGLLVYALALRFGKRWSAAVVGALAMVLFPNSVFAVGWLAAQNMLLVTVFMLAALGAYLSATDQRNDEATTDGRRRIRWGWYFAAVACWVMAVGARESALVFPLFLVAVDLAFGGWGRARAHLRLHVPIWGLALAFVVWRSWFFNHPMPDIYVRRPQGDLPAYALWAVAKLFHYLSAAIWPAPLVVGPTGRYAPWAERPFDQLGAVAAVAMVGGAYVLAAHRQRGWWLWPLWLLLAVAPMTPILATPHSVYLAGPAVGMGLAFALAHPARGWLRGMGRVLVVVVVIGVYGASNKAARLMWRGLGYAEQFVHDDMRADPPPAGAGDVFCINLPFAAIYAPWVVEPAEGMPAPRWHVLTFAPDLPRMEARSRLTQLDDYSFEIEVGPREYFSGLLGRFLLSGFGQQGVFRAGTHLDHGVFAIDVMEANAGGVGRLRFTFPERLDSPRYCFYLSSFTCGALRVQFGRPSTEDAQFTLPMPRDVAEVRAAAWKTLTGDMRAAATVFGGLLSPKPQVRDAAATALDTFVPEIADATAAPLRGTDAQELWQWFGDAADARTLRFIFREREARYDVRHRRDELKRARALVAPWIRSDLYFTGPPFPDPR